MPSRERARAIIQDKVRVASEGGGYVYLSLRKSPSAPKSAALQVLS